MTRRPSSTCDAPGCDLIIPRGQLMCRAHWFATPTHLRRAISDAWKGRRITEWSGHCLEARAFHAGIAARRTTISARKHEENGL